MFSFILFPSFGVEYQPRNPYRSSHAYQQHDVVNNQPEP